MLPKFEAATLNKGYEGRGFTMPQHLILLNEPLDQPGGAVLAHEWCHLQIANEPFDVLKNGQPFSGNQATKVLTQLQTDLAGKAKTQNKNEQIENILKLQYVIQIGELTTLTDEWDIHMHLYGQGSSVGVQDLILVAQHLEKRIKAFQEFSQLYRSLKGSGQPLTEDAKKYGDAILVMESRLKGLVPQYFDQITNIASKSDLAQLRANPRFQALQK